MEKLYYTIGEAAEIIGENVSLVRYWSNCFSRQLKPKRNAKGNRMYTPSDIETLKQIHHLVNVKGLTLEGAAKQLDADRKGVDRSVKVLESLRGIRERLVEIRKGL